MNHGQPCMACPGVGAVSPAASGRCQATHDASRACQATHAPWRSELAQHDARRVSRMPTYRPLPPVGPRLAQRRALNQARQSARCSSASCSPQPRVGRAVTIGILASPAGSLEPTISSLEPHHHSNHFFTGTAAPRRARRTRVLKRAHRTTTLARSTPHHRHTQRPSPGPLVPAD